MSIKAATRHLSDSVAGLNAEDTFWLNAFSCATDPFKLYSLARTRIARGLGHIGMAQLEENSRFQTRDFMAN